MTTPAPSPAHASARAHVLDTALLASMAALGGTRQFQANSIIITEGVAAGWRTAQCLGDDH